MPRMVSRIVRWMSRSAWVVTSPMTTQSPLVIAVSQATRASGSCPSIPSSTASETWSQILSGCPSVTDSDVSRNDGDELKEVVTAATHDIRPLGEEVSGPVVVPAVLRFLAKQLRLEGEDVVQHAVDPAAFEPVVGDHSRPLEVAAQRRAQRPVDPRLAVHLRLLEKLQAPIQRELPGPMLADVHQAVPSTSTRRSAVTRACTGLSVGSA